MMPLFTTTPRRIRKPVSVFALRSELPVRIRAISDPSAARGILKSRTNGIASDSNTAARIMNIRRNAIPIRL